MKSKYIIIIIILAVFSGSSFAQEKSSSSTPISQFVGVSWEIAIPQGNIISKTSTLGGRFEYRKFLSDKFSAGVAISMNSVEQLYDTKTYEKADGSVAVTTDMVRQAFTMPMTLTAHYYPGLTNHFIKPYIGLGLGAEYSSQNIYYNIYVIENSNWGFVARPEIGTLVLFSDKIAGIASAGYNYSTNKIDELGVDGFKQVTFNVGLAFLID
jgi:outer membrane protein W